MGTLDIYDINLVYISGQQCTKGRLGRLGFSEQRLPSFDPPVTVVSSQRSRLRDSSQRLVLAWDHLWRPLWSQLHDACHREAHVSLSWLSQWLHSLAPSLIIYKIKKKKKQLSSPT